MLLAGAPRITLIAPETLSCLMAYDWPGNVRELENVIERAIVLGTTEQILPDDLPESIVESHMEPSASGAKFHEMIREIKKQLVGRALQGCRRHRRHPRESLWPGGGRDGCACRSRAASVLLLFSRFEHDVQPMDDS